jgi:hypothetical protein
MPPEISTPGISSTSAAGRGVQLPIPGEQRPLWLAQLFGFVRTPYDDDADDRQDSPGDGERSRSLAEPHPGQEQRDHRNEVKRRRRPLSYIFGLSNLR